jgi:hypothetical protein
MEQHPSLCRRVVVPARLKWEIRDKLDQANINERVLFPDLDGLSRWLTRYYLPADLAAHHMAQHVSATDFNERDRDRRIRRPGRPAPGPKTRARRRAR